MAKFKCLKKLKLKYKIMLCLLFIALVLPVGISLTKYVTQKVKDYVMESNNFFFNSDKLTANNELYEINNWGGTDVFQIQFQLNNHKNNILTSKGDISYTTSVTCSSGVVCALSSTSGTIYENEKTDNITLTVTPTRVFEDDESVTVNVSATSSSPYVKTLSARFVITVGKRGVSYTISDQANSPYLLFKITNALESYKVSTAFSTYHVGDTMLASVYSNLTDAEKANCYSTIVTLSFDPHNVIIDTTSSILDDAIEVNETRIDGIDYISSIKFKVDAASSVDIRFYKKNVSNNYSYPGTNSSSIISFNAL